MIDDGRSRPPGSFDQKMRLEGFASLSCESGTKVSGIMQRNNIIGKRENKGRVSGGYGGKQSERNETVIVNNNNSNIIKL